MSYEIEHPDTTTQIVNEEAIPYEPVPKTAFSEDDVSAFLDDEEVSPADTISEVIVPPEPAPAAVKPKRASRKKKVEKVPESDDTESEEAADEEMEAPATEPPVMLTDTVDEENDDEVEDLLTSSSAVGTEKPKDASILTLEVRGEVETYNDRADIIWHEIHNAYRTRKILTGQLGGVEQTENNKTIVIVDYKGYRVVIPLKEMMLRPNVSLSGQAYTEFILEQQKMLGRMIGAEIDFIVRGIDSNTRAVVASRKDAMMKKRQTFYMDVDAYGMHKIHKGRLVQARVIGVAEKAIRVEIFGVDCSINARDLAWYWIGDAREYYSIGDSVLVRILSVSRDSIETIRVKADVRSVTQDNSRENLKKCRVQSKYAGRVTDIHKGVVFIRLSNGVNAIAHSCYDYRTPGKKDDVSFVVTRLDEDRGVAVGIITRVIRRNL